VILYHFLSRTVTSTRCTVHCTETATFSTQGGISRWPCKWPLLVVAALVNTLSCAMICVCFINRHILISETLQLTTHLKKLTLLSFYCRDTMTAGNVRGNVLDKFIHSFILDISIAPLQVHCISARILCNCA